MARVAKLADLTKTIVYLLDDNKSGCVTGAILHIDGGVVAGRN
jgi:enoyl-[acyl-carrier-protein] reductase (NADH)